MSQHVGITESSVADEMAWSALSDEQRATFKRAMRDEVLNEQEEHLEAISESYIEEGKTAVRNDLDEEKDKIVATVKHAGDQAVKQFRDAMDSAMAKFEDAVQAIVRGDR